MIKNMLYLFTIVHWDMNIGLASMEHKYWPVEMCMNTGLSNQYVWLYIVCTTHYYRDMFTLVVYLEMKYSLDIII